MSDDEPDRDLREAFARLRQEERERIVPVMSPVRPPRAGVFASTWRVRPLRAAAAIVVIVGGAVLLANNLRESTRMTTPVDPTFLAVERWISPTDFLLQTPGSELLSTVPSFGSRFSSDSLGAHEPRPANQANDSNRRTS